VFLNNYKDLPRGERAPTRVLWLAKSLVSLNQPNTRAARCDVLKQLGSAYRDKLTAR
jgi:TolA-binding protein